MTFVPHYECIIGASGPTSFYDPGDHLVRADGSVIANFSHYTYVDAVFSDDYKINISTKKEVKNGVYLSGGLVTEFEKMETGEVQGAAKDYIQNHLDYFKGQAFSVMPEAKKATRIDIIDPDGLYAGRPNYTEFFPNNT